MKSLKISVAIPYRDRLENLELVLASLAAQTLPAGEFEVVIGAMDYEPQLVEICKGWLDRLAVMLVISPRPFEIPAARNIAMKAASGRVCLQMDADTFLHKAALERLYAENFADGNEVCVLGQVLGYGNNNDGDVERVERRSFEDYSRSLDALIESRRRTPDLRLTVPRDIPWSFVWTGFAAVPISAVNRDELYFDEDFKGWGVDDLEWGYKIARAGLPIVLRDDLFALHLPHERSIAANKAFETLNFRLLLSKWRTPDVELVAAFNDIEANRLYRAYLAAFDRLPCASGCRLGSAVIVRDTAKILLLAAEINGDRLGERIAGYIRPGDRVETLPYFGLAVPSEDQSYDQCLIFPPGADLPDPFRSRVEAEARRLSKSEPLWIVE